MSRRIQLAPGETWADFTLGAQTTAGVAYNVSAGDWIAHTWITDEQNNVLMPARAVPDTVQVDSISKFLARLTTAESEQYLTTTGNDTTVYKWWMSVESESNDHRDKAFVYLDVDCDHAAVAEPVEVVADALPDPVDGTTPFNTSNPDALPARAPTDAELEALALIGDFWLDQQLYPGSCDVPASDSMFYWLRQQSDQVRNAINALIVRAKENSAALPSLATATAPGLMSPDQFQKLDSIDPQSVDPMSMTF